EMERTAGSLEYEGTGGAAPVIVLLHGLLMTGALWDQVVDELRPGFRCVRPTLPMGAHRRPMRAEADLSLRGQGSPARRVPRAPRTQRGDLGVQRLVRGTAP